MDRNFSDGSGLVHTCLNENCKAHALIFYPQRPKATLIYRRLYGPKKTIDVKVGFMRQTRLFGGDKLNRREKTRISKDRVPD